MLKLWGMQSTPSLPSLPGLLEPGVIASDRSLSMDQTEVNRGFKSLQFLYLNCAFMLNCIA